MQRLLLLFLALLTTPSAFAQLRGGLDAQLGALAPGALTTAVVVLDGDAPASPAFTATLQSVGITRALQFRSLPIVGVAGTAAQIRALANAPGVRGVWPNEKLTYSNYDARHLTGVEKLRTEGRMRNTQGLPFSGKGVAVVVNDSGIDGALPDLQYGNRTVQNVLGVTNLQAYETILPVTYTEGIINTDVGGSGHGTHVAGTVGGSGASSGGRHAGVAPGADLIGYGSGAALFVLDGIGGFDYAITNQFRYGIRVITNSWGSSGAFEPEHPINIVSYAAYKRGITVLFAAGNEGPGEDTHNPYAVAPWVISVGAGDKFGRLADFSSRGRLGDGGTFTMPDGTTWTYKNEPTVVAPGVDIISARATTGAVPALSAEADVAALGANAAFYTHSSGTSMATPHVAGIVALLLEAKPTLGPDDVKRLLQATATNMPGHASWEVGAGYVNAYAATAAALGLRADWGTTLNSTRTFNANPLLAPGTEQPFSVDFAPVGPRDEFTFEVGPNVAIVTARADVPDNTIAVVLTDPNGNRYGSSITLPLLGETAAVSAPGVAGTWKITVSGIGSVSGVALDPLRVTNGYALPGTVSGVIRFTNTSGYEGLSDVSGHPAAGAILFGVDRRLLDAQQSRFRPDSDLLRLELAEYLVMGLGIRQARPLDGARLFNDVPRDKEAFAEAVVMAGAPLKDRFYGSTGVMAPVGALKFEPNRKVSRTDLAYALVQGLGLHAQAAALNAAFADGSAQMAVRWDDRLVPLSDAGQIPANRKGYVQLALDLGLMNATFSLTQGPFSLTPTVSAAFNPTRTVKRGEYAVAAMATYERYQEGDLSAALGNGGSQQAMLPGLLSQTATEETAEAEAFAYTLSGNAPNPFTTRTEIRFSLPENMDVNLVVYDVLGREVSRVASGPMGAGHHALAVDAQGWGAGTYVYRLETARGVKTGQMVVVR